VLIAVHMLEGKQSRALREFERIANSLNAPRCWRLPP
jgi:hypothetical protein